jgi:hypothetical protein
MCSTLRPMDVARLDRWLRTSWPELVAASAVALGAGVRIQQFAMRRSLWLDEALLARNIVDRGMRDLLEPLGGNQGAPPGFLWLARLSVLAGGRNEYALRLLPLVAGLLLLPLVWVLARRVLDRPAAALATVVAAGAPALVRYSAEVKQYGVDATVAVGLVLLALTVGSGRGRDMRAVVALGVVGALAVWLSHPAVFVLAGCGSVLLLDAAWRRDRYGVVVAGAVAGLWALSFGALYAVSLRRLTENDALTGYWTAGFVPRPIGFGRTATWLWSSAAGYVEEIGGFSVAAPPVVATVLGSVLVAARRPVREALLLWASVPFLLVAAAVEQYPFRGRLALFLLPFVLVAFAGLATVPRRWWRLGGVAVVAVLSIAPMTKTVELAVDRPLWPHSRPVFEHVRDSKAVDDAVYIHGVTDGPYHFYGPILGLRAERRTSWSPLHACSPDADASAARLRPERGGRVWVVFAYTLSFRPEDEVEILRSHFDAVARRVSTFRSVDASATLYDFDAEPTDPTGTMVRRTSDLGCLAVSPL